VTSYCNVRLEVALGGAEWIDKQSVVDGKIISAQTWESHADFYRDIFEQLG
ncbi:MAG: DJ-1/PfpI family protein, partial [Verrucomicrobiales bacterium]